MQALLATVCAAYPGLFSVSMESLQWGLGNSSAAATVLVINQRDSNHSFVQDSQTLLQNLKVR
jgi:hypothetical protein